MILQHNIPSAQASRQYKISTSRQAKSSERLSSGYKINRAADDCANLTISEKMRSQIRGLNRASTNAEDGISLLQTADGALHETHAIAQRMRELAVQAANDTNTSTDRLALQQEIDSLTMELDRIADTTEFNTMKLLDGSLAHTSSPIQSAPIISTAILSGMQNVNDIIVSDPVISGSGVTSAQEGTLNDILSHSIVPQTVNTFLDTFPAFATAAANGEVSQQIGLELYSNSGSSTLASVAIQYSHSGGAILENSISLRLSVNVAALDFDASGALTSDSRSFLETTIVHEMMHAFMDDTLINGMIGATQGNLDSTNRFPSWFKEGMAQAATGGCANANDWVNGGLGLTETSDLTTIRTTVQSSSHKLSSGTTSSSYGTGYLACMYLAHLSAGSPATISSGSLTSGLNAVLRCLMNGDSLDSLIQNVSLGAYSSLSDFQNKFGDNASAQFISDLLGAVGSTGNGGLVNSANSLTASDLLPDDNASSSYYKVDVSTDFSPSSVGSSRNWDSGGAITAGTGTGGGGTGGGGTGGGGGVVIDALGPLNLQVGNLAGQGFAISLEDAHAAALGLTAPSVLTYEDAGKTIAACDEAISRISANRSMIGAFVNRLEHTVRNLDNISENTQAAESLIRDSDMAKEMMENAKNNILLQAGQSMIAQTSKMTESVLSLLQ